MNLSGRAVRAGDRLLQADAGGPAGGVRRHHPAARASCECGPKGSHGGQNGLRNIQEQLGTPDYPAAADRRRRRRANTGRGGLRAQPVQAGRAGGGRGRGGAGRAGGVWCGCGQGIDACMNRVNGEPKPEKPKKEKPAKPRTNDDRRRTTTDDRESETRNPRD